MKKPEELITRGSGNFINCTDYDDAIEAIKEYSSLKDKRIEDLEKALMEIKNITIGSFSNTSGRAYSLAVSALKKGTNTDINP